MRVALVVVALVVIASALSSCSPFYVLQAAYVESGILLRRQDIQEVVSDPDTTELERHKLALVADARQFAISLGLTPGDSFTKYSRVEGDTLAWVLMASKRDAFELHTWWFPIVGSVPYKGYFDKEDADAAGAKLAQKGFEFFVRGTDAFSTLGWFNDPVLSTILKNPDTRIVNTIIHESLHATVWIPNYVDFNESLANFVGGRGAYDFYSQREKNCQPNCPVQAANERLVAEQDLKRELEFAAFIDNLYTELDTLYKSSQPTEAKLSQRVQIFESKIAPLRMQHPNMKAFKVINNAEIMQLRLYLSHLELFRDLFAKAHEDWSVFLREVREIKAGVEKDKKINPFDLLRARLQ